MGGEKRSLIIIYLMGTILINIVCLNIIISVVTDNYDLVMQRIDAEDSRYKAQKMEAYHRIMNFLKGILKKFNFGDTAKQYLVVVNYKEHKAKSTNTQNGKFKALIDKIDASNKKLNNLQESFKDLKNQIDNQPKKD